MDAAPQALLLEAHTDRRPLAVMAMLATALAITVLLSAYALSRQMARQGERIAALHDSVAALKAAPDAPAAQATVPVPALPAPRAAHQAVHQAATGAAPRTARPARSTAAQPPAAPAAPPVRWGTTDLDRAIAAHPPVRVP